MNSLFYLLCFYYIHIVSTTRYKTQLVIRPYNKKISTDIKIVSPSLDKIMSKHFLTGGNLHKNIKFHKLSLFKFDWKTITEMIGNKESYGFKIEMDKNSFQANEKISYITSYNSNIIFNDLKKNPILCTIYQCDIGYIVPSKDSDNVYFNNVTTNNDKVHVIDNVILIGFITNLKKLILYEVPYNENNLRLTICPYQEWMHNFGAYSFIPKYGKNDNSFIVSGTNAHIIVPITDDGKQGDFFDCGILKLLSTHVHIGFKFVNDKTEPKHENNIDTILNVKFTCLQDENEQDYYHYISEQYIGPSSKIKTRFIKYISKTKKHFHPNRIIYMYKKYPIEKEIKLPSDKIVILPTSQSYTRPPLSEIEFRRHDRTIVPTDYHHRYKRQDDDYDDFTEEPYYHRDPENYSEPEDYNDPYVTSTIPPHEIGDYEDYPDHNNRAKRRNNKSFPPEIEDIYDPDEHLNVPPPEDKPENVPFPY
uniref:6-cysteine protein n=1 Tax=Parastrongyloides trichosuri TaxID=131310 RepID=A0A0N4Z1B7_PARTI